MPPFPPGDKPDVRRPRGPGCHVQNTEHGPQPNVLVAAGRDHPGSAACPVPTLREIEGGRIARWKTSIAGPPLHPDLGGRFGRWELRGGDGVVCCDALMIGTPLGQCEAVTEEPTRLRSKL